MLFAFFQEYGQNKGGNMRKEEFMDKTKLRVFILYLLAFVLALTACGGGVRYWWIEK